MSGELTTDVRVDSGDSAYFGEWFSRTLSDRALQGSEIADALGVSKALVSKWRNGKMRPGVGQCLKLAELLNVDPMRMLVTAGHADPSERYERLPWPEDKIRHEIVLDQLGRVTSLKDKERSMLYHTLRSAWLAEGRPLDDR